MKSLKNKELVKINDDVCIVGVNDYVDFRGNSRTTYTLKKIGYDEYMLLQKELSNKWW